MIWSGRCRGGLGDRLLSASAEEWICVRTSSTRCTLRPFPCSLNLCPDLVQAPRPAKQSPRPHPYTSTATPPATITTRGSPHLCQRQPALQVAP